MKNGVFRQSAAFVQLLVTLVVRYVLFSARAVDAGSMVLSVGLPFTNMLIMRIFNIDYFKYSYDNARVSAHPVPQSGSTYPLV